MDLFSKEGGVKDLQRSVHLQYMPYSRGEKYGDWRRGQTTNSMMQCFDSSNKIQ